MELTRKQVIEILEKADSTVYKEPKTKTAQALEYAISSLKTDEVYQIMYEGGEIFTKDEVISMLKELRFEIDECSYLIHSYLVKDGDNNMVKGITMRDINQVILNKINALKGDKS